MKHTVEQLLAQALDLLRQSSLIPPDLALEIKVERANDSNHGDFSTNLAMLLAKPCRQAPRQVAESLIQHLPGHVAVERVEIAGPGFINFFLHNAALSQVIARVLQEGEQFGRSQLGQEQKEILDFVSANSTSPLHIYEMGKPEQYTDLDLAKSKSNDNPVYSIQYAHARISSVLRQLQEHGLDWDEEKGLSHIEQLDEPQEVALISLISRYPEVIEAAARSCEPHQLACYLRELATGLHSYYNAVQLLCEQKTLRSARLCLLKAVQQVLRNGLKLIGVSTPESM